MTRPQPTWRNPQVRPTRGLAKKLLTQYAHLTNYKAKRRPDVICLYDPHGPFAPYNIAVLVEMKFPGDQAKPGQVKAYEKIAGKGKVKLMDTQTCGCRKKSKKTEAEEAQVKAAKKSAEEAAFVAAMIRGGIYIAKGAAIVVGGAVADAAGQL